MQKVQQLPKLKYLAINLDFAPLDGSMWAEILEQSGCELSALHVQTWVDVDPEADGEDLMNSRNQRHWAYYFVSQLLTGSTLQKLRVLRLRMTPSSASRHDALFTDIAHVCLELECLHWYGHCGVSAETERQVMMDRVRKFEFKRQKHDQHVPFFEDLGEAAMEFWN